MYGVVGNTEYKLSSKFDLIIPFHELIKHNVDCKVVTDYSHAYDIYNGYCIHVTVPGKPEYDLILGVCEDGINVEGTGQPYSRNAIITAPIEEGIKLLMNYWKFINSREEIESSLRAIGDKNDSINWFATCNYEAQHRIRGARNMRQDKCEVSLYY